MKEDFILGLDLGVGSVGWSCMKIDKEHEPCKLITANSYVFPSERGSLEDRRTARSLRRLIRRKKGRIRKVKQLFSEYGYLDMMYMKDFYNSQVTRYENPYVLKCKGLDEKLNMDELFICLIHYAKYRGFKSNRKNNEIAKSTANATEDQKLLYSIEQTQKELDKHDYTISQYILHDPKFEVKIKNTDGKFRIGITRNMILDEAAKLLDKQVEYGLINKTFRNDYMDTLSYQRSFSEGPNQPSPYAQPLTTMIGKCRYDQNPRAPLSAPSYELFVLVQKLQSIRYYETGTHDYLPLDAHQIKEIIDLALKGTEIKYKTVYKIIHKDVQFKGLVLTRKDYADAYNECEKNPEITLNEIRNELKLKQPIYQMKSLKYLQNEFKKKGCNCNELKIFDEISDLLSKFKSDNEIKNELEHYSLLSQQDDLFKQIVLDLDESKFKKFGKLSFDVLYQLLPFMIDQNLIYSDALNLLGYHHSKKEKAKEIHDTLPSIEIALEELTSNITNKAVIVTLHETRNITNALISQYGRPYAIHVELARELFKNKKERSQILDQQLTNKMNKMNIKMQILNKYPFIFNDISNIHYEDIMKYRLYMEQGGIDPYTLAMTGDESQAKIHEKDLFSRDYEIDHILPYSKSFDDTMSNKVLVRAQMNQEKGNQVPNMMLKDRVGYGKYLCWMQSIRDMKKRTNLLTDKITDEMLSDFSARSLNDTRYATRVLCDILRYYFPDIKIRSFTGQVTAKLKGVWGLNGYTHSYLAPNYRIDNEKDERLIKLQQELSKLVIHCDEDEERKEKLKKDIKSLEKEINEKDRNNHLHHALDATVLACATDKLRRRVEIHEQKLRQEGKKDKFYRVAKVNPVTGEFIEYDRVIDDSSDQGTHNVSKQFPKPYSEFHDEVIYRIYERDEQVLRKKLSTFSNYSAEDIKNVHPLYIVHKCDKKRSGRLHKATLFGVAPNPENQNTFVLTNRMRVNSEKFDYKKLEKIYDKEKSQHQIYEEVKQWLAEYKNGLEAFKAHNFKYPKNKNGNEIQKVKLNHQEPKEQICIHEAKHQYVEKENVLQICVYRKEDSDKLYFVGMDLYRIINLKKNPLIVLWSGQNTFEKEKYNDLEKKGYKLYKKFYKDQTIMLSLKNGKSGICLVEGLTVGQLQIGSLLGDGQDLLYFGLQTKIKTQQRVTVSTIHDIDLISMDILGNMRR